MMARKAELPEMTALKVEAEDIARRKKSVLRRLSRRLDELQAGISDGIDSIADDMAGKSNAGRGD